MSLRLCGLFGANLLGDSLLQFSEDIPFTFMGPNRIISIC